MTGASWALRTAPIVYRRPEPYSDTEMTLAGFNNVVVHRKHAELLTAAKYLHTVYTPVTRKDRLHSKLRIIQRRQCLKGCEGPRFAPLFLLLSRAPYPNYCDPRTLAGSTPGLLLQYYVGSCLLLYERWQHRNTHTHNQ